MAWLADLHIHSHFSMATSRESDPYNLALWAARKGVSLIGTGDFTHPGWQQELQEKIEPAEAGFYRLKTELPREIPDAPEVRLVVTGELSTIYKKNGRTRKVHHLVVLPSLEAAAKISEKLEALGMNIRSDGRPILGLDSYRLFELILNASPEAMLIPAHIWTPHFSVFGSNSGFDTLEECYADLSEEIFALETGLSSDPEMNWRWSALDRYALISNSDAHNPRNIAREANLFEAEFSYQGLRHALQNKNSGEFLETLEFYPEEGKYHYDGHRSCEIAWQPAETIAHEGICPVCGRKVTVGVLHRVNQLADRANGFLPEQRVPFRKIVPLKEIIGAALGVGANSNRVEQVYFKLLANFGPELQVELKTNLTEIREVAGDLVSEGIRRLRQAEVMVQPGYDGEYGVVSVFADAEREAFLGQVALFEEFVEPVKPEVIAERDHKKVLPQELPREAPKPAKSGLSEAQLKIITSEAPVMLVIAGPGTGKTRTLVERIVYLVQEKQVPPNQITAVTFTNKAAREIKERLQLLLNNPNLVAQMNLGTFHSLAWQILKQNPAGNPFQLLDQVSTQDLLLEILAHEKVACPSREVALALTLWKNGCPEKIADLPELEGIFESYQRVLRQYQRYDYDDLILEAVKLWQEQPAWLGKFLPAFRYLMVDEFQDVNPVQYVLVKLWAAGSQSLMAIGDPNQSIYGFRGASHHFFAELKEDYPTAVTYHLADNFRSPAAIVTAGNSLVKEEFKQVAASQAKASLSQLAVLHETAGAAEIVAEIEQLLGGVDMLAAARRRVRGRRARVEESFGFSEIAILYRSNKQALAIEKALLKAGLPYQIVGQKEELEVASCREFLAVCRYLLQPNDVYLLRVVLQTKFWDFTPVELGLLTQVITNSNTGELLPNIDWSLLEQKLPERIMKLNKLRDLIEKYQAWLTLPAAEFLQDLRRSLSLEESEALKKLIKFSESYPNITTMLEMLPLSAEADLMRKGDQQESGEMITLSTIHAAKGLEYPVVFVIGLEEGLLPFGKDPNLETLAEEERLFYVAVTRAQRCLYLITAQNRFTANGMTPVEASRFLKLFPDELFVKSVVEARVERPQQLELF